MSDEDGNNQNREDGRCIMSFWAKLFGKKRNSTEPELVRGTGTAAPRSVPEGEVPSKPTSRSEEGAVKALAQKLASSERNERLRAMRQLGDTGSAAAVPPLLRILSEYGDDEFRRANLDALEKCESAFRAASAGASIARFVKALKSPQWRARLSAVVALGLVGDERVLPHLAAAKRDESPDVRLAAEIAWNRLPPEVRQPAAKTQAAQQRRLGQPPLTANRTVKVATSSDPNDKVIQRMAFTPDGDLAVGVGGEIHIIEPKTLQRLRTIGKVRDARRFDVDRSGRLVAVWGSIYAIESGALQHQLSPPAAQDEVFVGVASDLLAVALPGVPRVDVYAVADWGKVGSLPVPETIANLALLAPDHVVCQGHKSIAVFDARSQERLWSVESDQGTLYNSLCVSPDGYVVAGDIDGRLWVFDPQGQPEGKLGQKVYVGNGGNGVFTPDGGYLLVPGGGGVKVCDWRSREQLEVRRALPGTTESTMALAISADGAQLFSACTRGDITEWI